MHIANNSILRNTSSVAIPWTSDAIYVGSIIAFSIQLNYVTTNATIKLQCSLDEGKPLPQSWTNEDISNWTDVTDSIVSVTEDGDILYDVSDVSYKWLRVVVEGTGFVTNARFHVKGN